MSEPVLLLNIINFYSFLVDDKIKIDFIEIICFFHWIKYWLHHICLIIEQRKELLLA